MVRRKDCRSPFRILYNAGRMRAAQVPIEDTALAQVQRIYWVRLVIHVVALLETGKRPRRVVAHLAGCSPFLPGASSHGFTTSSGQSLLKTRSGVSLCQRISS